MKKFFPYILISVVILAAIFGPLGARLVQADACWSIINGLDMKACAAGLGYIILTLTSKVVALAGYFSDTAIDYSVVNFGTNSQTVVETGWTISRDIANLFFIFILLYIAIATILQLSGYGMKELLAKVIIIALLVNFSLMITRVIIDASNILAMEFYSKTKVQKMEGGKEAGKGSLSEALVAGINPQSLFNIKETETPGTETFKQGNQEATLMQITIITIMGSVLFLILAFVMFAAGILFVIRSVVLWILMILAPLAFLFMILPATKQYASQWWKKLFDQAFFAPVYLFLFYLVVKITSEGTLIKSLKADNQTFGSTFGSPNNANVQLILNFALLIVLTLACLIVAKQMGAAGAGAMINAGQKMKGAAQGYAGKISRRGAGKMAEGMLDEKSWINRKTGGWAKRMATAPIIGRGFARASALEEKEKKKQEVEYDKQYNSYSDAGLQAALKDPSVSEKRKAAIRRVQAKRTDIEKEKKELEQLEQALPHLESMVPNFEQKIRNADSALETILTNITATEYRLAEAVKQGDPVAENLAKWDLNNLKGEKAQNLIERQKAVEVLSEIKEHKERKEKLVEKRERRGETAGLQASISGIRTGGGGTSTP